MSWVGGRGGYKGRECVGGPNGLVLAKEKQEEGAAAGPLPKLSPNSGALLLHHLLRI